MKLLFTGDISLNDDYKSAENPFDEVKELFLSSDIVIGNIEAVCKGRYGENLLKTPRLHTDCDTLHLLKDLNLKIAALANNHIFDNLLDGFNRTIDFFNKNDIHYIGAEVNNLKESKTIFINDKVKFGFLNYVHPATNPNIPDNAGIKLNIYDKNVIITEIKKLKVECEIVILILHWGLDNSHFPEPWQRKDASSFIKAGADLIIGHHSHTLQGKEIINNKEVYYGLGNFAFSGFYLNGRRYDLDERRQRESVIVAVDYSNGKISTEAIPIKLTGLNVNRISSKKIYKLSKLIPVISNTVIWHFYKFYLLFLYKFYFYFFGNNRKPLAQLKKLNLTKFKRFLIIIKNYRN